MSKFEPGKTYFTRSVCDSDCIIKVEVIGRTDKTIKTIGRDGAAKTLRVTVWNGVETVKPWGSYSMAPIVSADRLAA
jgi:hypothetical protein